MEGDGLSLLLFNCAREYIIREWYQKNPKDIATGMGEKQIMQEFIEDSALERKAQER